MTTILIVDDHTINIQVLLLSLAHDNYILVTAKNGHEGLAIAQSLKPDLILLDVMLPGINGFDVCIRLKENAATTDISVIFLTSLSEPIDKLRGLEIGGEDYITKPFSPDEVRARIKTHLALREKRRHIEELRQQDLQYFNQINQMRDDILDQMKHDIKSPLGSIKASLYLISKRFPSRDPRLNGYINVANSAVDEVLRVIENLLEVAKLETGRAIHPISVEIVSLVEQIAVLFKADCEAKGLMLRVELDAIWPQSFAEIDPDQMTSALVNLISNAIKYTDKGGIVTLSVSLNQNTLGFQVSDTGQGIPEAYIDKIFERLYRIPSHINQVEGTGLGLYIVKSIIEQHGGTIHVNSVIGKGSTFSISVPQNHGSSSKAALSS